jgi:hypothetical protein
MGYASMKNVFAIIAVVLFLVSAINAQSYLTQHLTHYYHSLTCLSGTVVKAGAGGSITDASGDVWTITSGGQVAINGVTNTTSANILLLIDAKNLIWTQV